jgi:hypothetical protein
MPSLVRLSPLILTLSACGLAASGFAYPLDNASTRATPLHFGLYVTPDPAQNPIDPPERFTGYHAALDFEITEDEADAEVAVYAVCDGEIVVSELAEGYGGVIVQRCTLNGEDITVLYGHLEPDSMAPKGSTPPQGERIALLADAYSEESGNTRKHLHLGMHRGTDIVLLGYVQTKRELKQFLDPAKVLGL